MSQHLHPLPDWSPNRSSAEQASVSASEVSRPVSLPAIDASMPAGFGRYEKASTRLHRMIGEAWSWAGSFGVHCVILIVAALCIRSVEFLPEPAQITSVFSEPENEHTLPQLTQAEDVWNTNPDVPIAFTPTRTVAEAAQGKQAEQDPLDDMAIEETSDMEPSTEPEIDDTDMSEEVAGVEGTIINSIGDIGSVDQITLEIVNRIRKKKVVVVWLMDASESLRMRRQRVIGRFERIYSELDELAADQKDSLLTSVIAFGAKVNAMTPEPTADRESINQAVRDIPADETGVENVFTAIRMAAVKHHKYAIKGYDVMLVVLTDESGNDPAQLDAAIRQVKRDKMPVYVIGPLAPFAQNVVKVKWTDSQTAESFYLPVERGPESAAIEYPALPHWHDRLKNRVLSSGFGAFGLVRIVRESGGIYFLHNDGYITGPQFNDAGILSYVPDYVSADEYQRRIIKQPIRKAILQVVSASRQLSLPQPQTKFLAAGIQFTIRDSEPSLSKTYEFLDSAVQQLQAVEQFRDNDKSPRWQAHYDLLLGQLLLRRALLARSIPLLNAMYTKPRSCSDVTCNAWELVGTKGMSLADVPSDESDAMETSTDPDDQRKRKEKVRGDDPSAAGDDTELRDLQAARDHLQRVVERHAQTPWAHLAHAELALPVEWKWKETFVIPPEGDTLPWDKPPGEWRELSEEDKAKLNEAKERFERFRRERKKKKEQAEKKKVDRAAKKRKIPKL